MAVVESFNNGRKQVNNWARYTQPPASAKSNKTHATATAMRPPPANQDFLARMERAHRKISKPRPPTNAPPPVPCTATAKTARAEMNALQQKVDGQIASYYKFLDEM